MIKSKSSWVDNHGSLHESAFETALSEFTNIQMDTLRLLARGLSNAEIAKVRFVSEKSVEQIVARIAQNFHIEQDHTHNLRVLITGRALGLLPRQQRLVLGRLLQPPLVKRESTPTELPSNQGKKSCTQKLKR